jgi:hypothetical protein
MRSRFAAPLLACSLALVAQAQFRPGLAEVPGNLKPGFDSISPKDGKEYLGFLAGPECEGRGSGEPGFEKAANYVAAHFKKLGLKSVMADGSYFQYNDFWRVRTDPKSLAVSVGGKSISVNDIGVVASGKADISAPGMLLVLGKEAPEKLDDSVAAQLKDKVVFVVGTVSRGVRLALLDAKAVVTVAEKVSAPGWTGRASDPGTAGGGNARLMVKREGLSNAIGQAIYQPRVIPATVTELGNVVVKASMQTEKIKIMNVVAKLEGSDPKLKEEYIGIGGHLDHLGNRNGTIYYGADDDGSGSTGVMQVAKALAMNPVKPKRSVLFMAFYGEEMGLLGSAYLANNSPINLDNMVAELQMDMIGRDSYGAQNGDQKRIDKVEENGDTMRLVGSKRISTELDRLLMEANQSVGFKFKYDAEDVYTRSDHYNFARKGIPIAFFFCGFTPDYHQPTDTVDKINFDKIANTAKLVYLTTHALGDYKGRLPKDVKN